MADAIIEKQAEYVAERQEHQNNIPDNYRRLLDSASPTVEERPQTSSPAAPQYAAPSAYTPLVDNAARIRDYNAYRVHTGQRTLFDGGAPASEDLVMSVPVADAMPTAATMNLRARAAEKEEEDVLPTPATMAMLARVEAAEEREEIPNFGFFASLSTRLKVALTVVTAAILVAIAVIFINTNVLRSMDERIESGRASLQQLEERYRSAEERLTEATDPDNIDEWAQRNGMVKRGLNQQQEDDQD